MHRRSANRSINAVRRANRLRRTLATALRAGCTLCLASLSLSNAPPGNSAGPLDAGAGVRIALAEVQAIPAPSGAKARLARDLRQCRSHLDGSFGALVAVAVKAAGEDAFEHVVTDMARPEGREVAVTMLFQTRSESGVVNVRQARATIDLASCEASQVSLSSV